jgi:hypothetical protein
MATSLINDQFDDTSSLNNWTDLSKCVTWGTHTGAASAFTVANGSCQLIRSGTDDTRSYTSYNSGLKTFTSLDKMFASPIDHATNIVTIEFRTRWEVLQTSSNGERGRFIVSLNYGYPTGGLDTTIDERYNDFSSPGGDASKSWWARPAYHVRIRSGDGAPNYSTGYGGTTLLQYGGYSNSQYEKYDSNSDGNPEWWLPGYISSPGPSGGAVSPGTSASQFPTNAWVETSKGLAATTWQRFKYVISPDKQEIWSDANDDGVFDLQATMNLPQTSTAPQYQYFPTFEGVRLFWNGGWKSGLTGDPGQVYLDYFKLDVTPTPEPVSAVLLAAGAIGLLRRRRSN